MTSELPDDELLNLPTANLRPGELVRAFQLRAVLAVKKLAAAQPDDFSLMLMAERKEEAKETAHEEMQRREALLLAQLEMREHELAEQSERLDARTIKLDDGRRVYVDKDKYRDEQGSELKDADRAQAEIHHLDHPDAATWQEHQEIERQKQATAELRQKVEKLDQGSPEAKKALAGYEKQFQADLAVRQREVQKTGLPDYGDGDYMEAFGLTGTFKQAGITPTAGGTAPPTTTSPAQRYSAATAAP